VSAIVLKLLHDKTEKSKFALNHLITLLDTSEFDFKVFTSVQKKKHLCGIFTCFGCCCKNFCRKFSPKDVYYVLLTLSEGEVEANAERLDYL
jgi:hypothetical protein